MTTLLAVNNYHYFRAGAETVYLEENRLFESMGWRVVPFAMRHPRNLPTPWSDYFVDDIEFDAHYSLAQRLRRAAKVVYSFEARRKLGRLLDRVKPDICHAHNIYHHISPSILGLLKHRSIPTVMTLHDLKIACPAYKMLTHDGICERCRGGRLYNVVANRCIKGSVPMSALVMAEAILHRALGSYQNAVNCFIVPSRFYIQKFVEWGMSPSKFRHIPNFVDVNHYKPQFSPGSAFIYVGRLAPEKGLLTLIRAAARAGCRLSVAGDGPELGAMRALAAELRADVEFLGFLGGDALHAAIHGARALVLPSEWYENSPMSLLEAYALGKPVIGAAIGGIPELIREGDSGVTFASGNVDALAGALAEFGARNDANIESMGRYARNWVEREFTAEQYCKRVLDLYRELGVSHAGSRVLPVVA